MRSRTILSVALAATLCGAFSALGAVTGTVINSDGAPVAGAKVSLFVPETLAARRVRLSSKDFERKPLATVTTGQNGAFSLDSPKGEPLLDLSIVAAGFAPGGTRVVPDEDIGAQALITAPPKSGTISANGKPLAGATVIWIGNETELPLVTDANGKYSVPEPEKWASLLVVMHPDYAPIEDLVVAILGKKPLDRTLTAGTVIKGRVLSADGTTPVANAAVILDNWPVATSGADGSFTVPHAKKEWEDLSAISGDRATSHAHATTDVNLKLARAASISGVVRDAVTQQPVAGVELRLAAPGPRSIASHTVFTDAKGNYSFASIPAGIYLLNANRPGFSTLPLNVAPKAGQALQKNVYLNERGRMTGTVLDEDKRPVAGTHLLARNGGRGNGMMVITRGGPPQAALAATAPDGRFVLRSVEPNPEVVIEATKRGMPGAHTSPLKLAAGEKKTGITIVIPRGVAFSGKVTDGSGRALSGVAVEATEAENDGGPMGGGGRLVRRMVNIAQRGGTTDDQLVRTGSDGTFSLKLKAGKYDVGFKREGFAAKLLRAQEVAGGGKPVEVKLDPGVEITGHVTRGGMPVEGVNVTAIGEEGINNTQTMPDGTFRISDLSPGSYMVSINKMESFIQTMRSVTAPAQSVNVELPSGGRISGRVLDKTSHEPVTSFQAGVTMSRSGGGMMIMTPPMTRQFTSDDGSFTLENVPPGQTQLVVNAPGYTTGRLSGLTIEDGKALTNLEVDLDTGVKLTGRVTGPDGAPLSGVTIREDDTPGAGGRLNLAMGNGGALTDPNGEYTIDSLEPGEKTFSFNRNGYLGDSKTINLSGRENRLDVQLSSGQPAIGQVVSDAGGPVADATVSAMSAAEGFGQRTARTDASGGFQFDGLAPGHYTFTATKNGFAQGVIRDFDISSGAPVRIVMAAGGIITGHVTGLSGQDLSTATVLASGPNGNASAPVDNSGNYRIEGSPLGTVHLSARTGQVFGGTAKSSSVKTIQVDAGSSVTADLEFKTGTVISGRVTRAGQPLANANVVFIGRSSGVMTRNSVSTDSSGSYSIDSVEDGSYTVQVTDSEITPYTTPYKVSGSATFDINIVASAVRGRVTNTDGEPVNDAMVQITGKGTDGMFANRTASTDSNGNFSMSSVAPGSYTASVQKTGYGNDPHDITVSTSDVEVEFKVAKSDGVTLRVVDARDQRMLAAFAQAYDSAGREVDPNLFRGFGSPAPITLAVSPGAYRVIVSAIGYATQTVSVNAPSPGPVVVPLTPGGTLLIHTKTSGLTGRLMDSTGHLYLISLRGFPQGGFALDTTATGTTVNNVAGGTYTLQVMNGTAVVNTTPVTVVEGQQTEVTI